MDATGTSRGDGVRLFRWGRLLVGPYVRGSAPRVTIRISREAATPCHRLGENPPYDGLIRRGAAGHVMGVASQPGV
jgi:hypothetical protein